jgi:DNA-binding transcriptional ArsR family regulator
MLVLVGEKEEFSPPRLAPTRSKHILSYIPMGQMQKYIGHSANQNGKQTHKEDFVLEKSIFSNIFEKDIRRVFIYKKAERIAKALTLISPAFSNSVTLKSRIDALTIQLIDSAMLGPYEIRSKLPRELLALSSILSMARMSGILSAMNAEIISHEAHMLLEEVTGYEDTALVLDDVPSISTLAKNTSTKDVPARASNVLKTQILDKGHVKDIVKTEVGSNERKSLILSLIQSKGRASIKDISTVVRGVSEKTIQRELSALVEAGVVVKTGERRWSIYALA